MMEKIATLMNIQGFVVSLLFTNKNHSKNLEFTQTQTDTILSLVGVLEFVKKLRKIPTVNLIFGFLLKILRFIVIIYLNGLIKPILTLDIIPSDQKLGF